MHVFEMKDLEFFLLGLQLENLVSGVLVYEPSYSHKSFFKKINIYKSYPSKTRIAAKSLDINKDYFRHGDDEEAILGPESP